MLHIAYGYIWNNNFKYVTHISKHLYQKSSQFTPIDHFLSPCLVFCLIAHIWILFPSVVSSREPTPESFMRPRPRKQKWKHSHQKMTGLQRRTEIPWPLWACDTNSKFVGATANSSLKRLAWLTIIYSMQAPLIISFFFPFETQHLPRLFSTLIIALKNTRGCFFPETNWYVRLFVMSSGLGCCYLLR